MKLANLISNSISYRKLPSNKSGIGILEVIVAAGIFSLIGAGIATLLTNSFKQQRGLESKDTMRQFSVDIEHLLASNSACVNTFSGFTFDTNNQITVTQIKDGTASATVRYNTGDTYLGNLTFQNARLQDFVPDNSSNPNLGKAKLHLYTRKVGDTMSAPLMHQVLSLKVLRSPANGIQDCASTNTTNFWLSSASNLDDIYYTRGKVGIGTNNPMQALEVVGGLTLNPGATTVKPSCQESTRGTIWFSKGTGTTADSAEVCMKGSDVNNYAWSSVGGSSAGGMKNFFEPGTYQFTVPAGVTTMEVQVWGAGGGGAGNGFGITYRGYRMDTSGMSGGGGGYSRKIIRVTPGNVLSVIVGRGGRSGRMGTGNGEKDCSAQNGGQSVVRMSTNTIAQAGGGSSGCNFITRYNGGGGNGGVTCTTTESYMVNDGDSTRMDYRQIPTTVAGGTGDIPGGVGQCVDSNTAQRGGSGYLGTGEGGMSGSAATDGSHGRVTFTF